MRSDTLLKHMDTIRKKQDNNKLVIFAGAGVSCNVPDMPSWQKLVKKMAEAIGFDKCNLCGKRQDCDKKAPCAEQYTSDELLKIPQYVYNRNHKLYDQIIKDNISEKVVPDAPLSKAIFDISPAHIITTNYDTLLEASNCPYAKQYEVIVNDKDLLKAEKNRYIIKMHGDVRQLDTIVLKEQDYLEYSEKHVLIELFIKALLADHTIMFLGYTLNDYNVKLIVGWINYLRLQSVGKSKADRIGYIVLDEKTIDRNTIKYFRNNNIEVLNVHSLKLIDHIPGVLFDDRGKRLFSFLNMIKHPELEKGFYLNQFIDRTVEFLSGYRMCDYRTLMHALDIASYEIVDDVLNISDAELYDQIINYLEASRKGSGKLKQLFVNAGIRFVDNRKRKGHYHIDESVQDKLINDYMFSMYVKDEYNQIADLYHSGKEDLFTRNYYKYLIEGISEVEDIYEEAFSEAITDEDRIAFLNNQICLDDKKSYNFLTEKVRLVQFIENITSEDVVRIFEPYSEMYEGNIKKIFIMQQSLQKLKEDVQKHDTKFFNKGLIAKLYEIKKIAIAHYYFLHTNKIFAVPYKEEQMFFLPYIEGILCGSSNQIEEPSNVMGFGIRYQKYCPSVIDFDIRTKKIETEELYNLLGKYPESHFSVDEEMKLHLISCASNIAEFIKCHGTFNNFPISITILSNLLLILMRVELGTENKNMLSEMVHCLFNDQIFNQLFWNRRCYVYKSYSRVFGMYLGINDPRTDVDCVRRIVNASGFFDCMGNTSNEIIRSIVLWFLKNKLSGKQIEEIYQIIDEETDVYKKIKLLVLFFRIIPDGSPKEEYMRFLGHNYSSISQNDLYDFIFNDWLKPGENDMRDLFKQTLMLNHCKKNGLEWSPGRLEGNLEIIYILYITDIVKDISAIKEMAQDYPHLQFLLYPESFDYKQVDFANYMWANFSHSKKTMHYFVEHKDDIMPRIVERLKMNKATENEKKVLYGFFLDEKEIWNIG